MSELVIWQEVKYKEVFESELRGLKRRRASDSSCKPVDIEGILKNLYIMEGADSLGRGELQDISIAATIAAHEKFICDWKKELNHEQ